MKTALVSACILACCLAVITTNRSFAEKNPSPASVKKNVVMGHLKTRDKMVTISRGDSGPIYTVKDKEGKTLDIDLGEKQFQAKYPSLYDQVKEGRAGNDASLRKTPLPKNERRE